HLDQWLQMHFLEAVVDLDVVRLGAICFSAGSRYLDVIALAMDGDLELKRRQLQLVSHRGSLGREGRQWFRCELAAGPLLEDIIGNGREQGECEKVLLALGLVSRVPPRLWH